MHVGTDFSQVYACGYKLQTGVCVWVHILDRCVGVVGGGVWGGLHISEKCMHVATDFRQVYQCMWVQFSDSCMHVDTMFKQAYAYGYSFQADAYPYTPAYNAIYAATVDRPFRQCINFLARDTELTIALQNAKRES